MTIGMRQRRLLRVKVRLLREEKRLAKNRAASKWRHHHRRGITKGGRV